MIKMKNNRNLLPYWSKSACRTLCVLGQGAVGSTFTKSISKLSGKDLEATPLSWRTDLGSGKDSRRIREMGTKYDLIFFATRDADTLKALEFLSGTPAKKVAFSASFQHPDVEIMHPLMTFHPQGLKGLDDWSQIPIVGSLPKKLIHKEWTFLKGPYFYLPKSTFPIYHAQIVAGFSVANEMWSEVGDFLATQNIPNAVLKPLMHQWVDNFVSLKNPLTGPLARREFQILESHIQRLAQFSKTRRQKWRVECLDKLKEMTC